MEVDADSPCYFIQNDMKLLGQGLHNKEYKLHLQEWAITNQWIQKAVQSSASKIKEM